MTGIAARADFERIRYAQLWEDADVLVAALRPKAGGSFVSICSAGDNALALLTLDPVRVIAVDLSPAQLACLRLRIAAYRGLAHGEFLELLGSRPSVRRGELLDRVGRTLSDRDQRFWAERRDAVTRHGAGGIGKFERYFRIFRRLILPLAHARQTVASVFEPRDRIARTHFLEARWNNWRWRLLLKVFFSNFMMGRLGRDPAFFAHVEGSLSDHVARRMRHAVVDLPPENNPYLRWILTGTHSEVLPLPWREEHFDTIRCRLDRLNLHLGPLEDIEGSQADGFNLSDIFEYMAEDEFWRAYGSILELARPGARLVYWNMMVPRERPEAFAARVCRLHPESAAGRASDKAFFYNDFHVDEVL